MGNVLKKSIQVGGRALTLETGRMAKQASGAVFCTYGDTAVLVTAVGAKEPKEGVDFFPLTVDYEEKIVCSRKNSRRLFETGRQSQRKSHFVQQTD